MEIIDDSDLDEAEPKTLEGDSSELTGPKFKEMMEEMENPILAQKQMAVKIKHFLDRRIDKEMREKKYLSDHTRRWVESYNNLLEKIQKAMYGEKSVNLHIHKVTHGQIAARMRKVSKD